VEKRLAKLELLVCQRHSQRTLAPSRLDLSGLSVDERFDLYDLTDRARTAAEEMRHRELWSRVRGEEAA
jgi:hypothetical protein